MKHLQSIFSLLFIMLGIVIITISKIIEEVIPKLGMQHSSQQQRVVILRVIIK